MIIKRIREMRSQKDAPVDEFGCDKLVDKSQPKDV